METFNHSFDEPRGPFLTQCMAVGYKRHSMKPSSKAIGIFNQRSFTAEFFSLKLTLKVLMLIGKTEPGREKRPGTLIYTTSLDYRALHIIRDVPRGSCVSSVVTHDAQQMQQACEQIENIQEHGHGSADVVGLATINDASSVK